MVIQDRLAQDRVDITSNGVDVSIAMLRRTGARPPVVFLHGFGSTKEDYADVARLASFGGRGLLVYDAPGAGQSECADLRAVSVPFLVDVAEQVLAEVEVDRFHLIGHSMGGLTGLLLARRHPERVLSFVDIEGNLAPEDCFLSRQILTHPVELEDGAGADEGKHDEAFLDAFIERARQSTESTSALYAAGLRHKVRAAAVRGIFESMVELSDHGDLVETFLSLPFPRMFMYGEQNASLSYLPYLRRHNVELVEIEHSGHWPMYSNPVAMWQAVPQFLDRAETEQRPS